METLRLSGELSIYRAASLKPELLNAVGRDGCVEIDLSGVDRIDSAAIQLLLLAKREMAAKGGRLLLVNHSAPVVEAMDLYGLSVYFGDPVLIQDTAGG
jgi:anti-anti-sigma factor